MNKSEKQQQQTEKFLAERGYSFNDLTAKQQQIVEVCIRSKRITKYSIVIIVILSLLLGVKTYRDYLQLRSNIGFVNSKDIIFYAVITENDDRILEPQQVQQLTSQVVEISTVNGFRIATTLFLLVIIVTAFIQDRDKRKLIDAFLPKTGDSKENPEEDNK